MSPRRAALALASLLLVAACDGSGGGDATSDATPDDDTEVSVAVPPERRSPFCEAMVELIDEVRIGDVDDVDALVLETYREVSGMVPAEIADDFALVLAALEDGGPLPTDAPRPTVPTSVPETVPPDGTAPADFGFAPTSSPAERISAYIEFTCRASANNPGPPATEPP